MSLILLLEDDDGLRFALSEALEVAGHDVLEAANCREADKLLYIHQPDVLLLDLVIGGGNSVSVATFAAHRAPDAEIVYMTGSNLYAEGELFGMVPNVRWVLRKPVPVPDMLSMIDHVSSKPMSRMQSTTAVNA